MDDLTKNDHLRAMLVTVQVCSFRPWLVAFDSWCSSLANLKAIRDYGWSWLTQLKGNRLVAPDRSGNRRLQEVAISPHGTVVHFKGYGLIPVFRLEGYIAGLHTLYVHVDYRRTVCLRSNMQI
jgi:hypothetical protein